MTMAMDTQKAARPWWGRGRRRHAVREREVLSLMVTGERNGRIATRLHVTEGATVKHIGNTFAELGPQPEDGNRRVLAVLR